VSALLAVLPDKDEREQITRMFEAYFRVGGEKNLAGTIVDPDLPKSNKRNSANAPPTGGALVATR